MAIDENVKAVVDMFTSGIEKSIVGSKISSAGGDSGRRARHRHEAIAQWMLAQLLDDPQQLRAFAREFELPEGEDFLHVVEAQDLGNKTSRFDHVIFSQKDGRDVAIIEDKIDAAAGKDQFKRYCAHLKDMTKGGRLIVLHPDRRSGEWGDGEEYKGATVTFLSWHDLGERMAARVKSDQGAATSWRALAMFAENVGTGDLSGLAGAEVLLDRAAAAEVRDLIVTAQAVARLFGQGPTRTFRFSTHSQNATPWLQFRLTSIEKKSVGMQIDLWQQPGSIQLGLRGPDNYYPDLIPAKIGIFPEGKLSAAAEARVEKLKDFAKLVESGKEKWPKSTAGRGVGKELSPTAQDALALLAMVFHPGALRNPHRGGATVSAAARNEGPNGERLGVVLSAGKEEVDLLLGPAVGEPWKRAAIWIRRNGKEEEIAPRKGETGRQYVERVWKTSREHLNR